MKKNNKISQQQEEFIKTIWEEIVPMLLNKIISASEDADLGKLSSTLEKIVKLTQLVNNKPTERKEVIQNNTEVGTKPEQIQLTLETLMRCNKTLNEYFEKGGEEKVGTH